MAREVTMTPKGRGDIRKIQGKGVIASGPGMRERIDKDHGLALGREELWREKLSPSRASKACFLPLEGGSLSIL